MNVYRSRSRCEHLGPIDGEANRSVVAEERDFGGQHHRVLFSAKLEFSVNDQDIFGSQLDISDLEYQRFRASKDHIILRDIRIPQSIFMRRFENTQEIEDLNLLS